ncbi:restriction endonuclease subunit S [Wohlfahrtiimonas chitiniclastica]|uniref:restriction endonuclease subunit S n=1 Tax=Wohlfahrtiimonas chitiniclastica TaxID=400946 RepID=UPI000B985856|nr:restriction endonuclease subunit S [Wohlfahrtiimonas chitiniclastica]OYQ75962.1 hypothetical protein B9T18_00985 [Wohlfahrtiimonas chitiniclastica]
MQPKLRFPEFSGDWESNKLGDICSHFQSGKGITSDHILEVGMYPVYGGNGLRGYSNSFTHEGTFTLIGRQGALCGNINLVENKNYISEHAIAVQANDENSTYWLSYWLYQKNLGQLSESSAQPGLAVNKLVKLNIYKPTLREQTKIADFLSAVDKKITLLEQQQQAWQTYKQGMMQKLFSGELRFKDENGQGFSEWETSVVGNECVITTGNKDTQNKIDDGQYPFFVRSQTVESINTYSMDCEAILTSGDGVGVGKNYHYINGKFDFHQRVYCLYDFSEKIIGKYLFVYFSKFFFDRVKRLSAKNSVDSVRMDMISKMEIMLPCLAEQQKIADCLSGLDAKIENITEQLDKMREWKKGLLQQMFV